MLTDLLELCAQLSGGLDRGIGKEHRAAENERAENAEWAEGGQEAGEHFRALLRREAGGKPVAGAERVCDVPPDLVRIPPERWNVKLSSLRMGCQFRNPESFPDRNRHRCRRKKKARRDRYRPGGTEIGRMWAQQGAGLTECLPEISPYGDGSLIAYDAFCDQSSDDPYPSSLCP